MIMSGCGAVVVVVDVDGADADDVDWVNQLENIFPAC